jgi:hypothetical protein
LIARFSDSRVLREFEGVAPAIVHKLVDLVGWCGLQLTPTTSSTRGTDLVYLISTALTVITHIITNRVRVHACVCVLKCACIAY